MTNHPNPNSAAQAAEQEIDAIMEQAQVFASAWAFLGGPFDNGSGLEQAEREKANLRALLSKLRAPVADERSAVDPCGYVAVKVSAVDWLKDKFPALTIKAGLCERIGGRLYTITRLMRDHDAALASAPVAVPVTPDLQAQIVALRRPNWPSTGDRSSFHEGYETARVDILRLLRRSAPVAGEAQHPDDIAVDNFAAAMKAKLAKKRDEGRYGWQSTSHLTLSSMLYEHMYKGDPLDVGNLAMMLHQNRKPIELPEHARRKDVAPQASADAGITASTDVALLVGFIFDRFGQPGDAGELPDNVAAAVRRLELALKQPQADKDGGQQRAAFDHPVFAFLLGEGPLHGVHFGDRHPSERGAYWWRKDLRAALSAAQAEQGERDAQD